MPEARRRRDEARVKGVRNARPRAEVIRYRSEGDSMAVEARPPLLDIFFDLLHT